MNKRMMVLGGVLVWASALGWAQEPAAKNVNGEKANAAMAACPAAEQGQATQSPAEQRQQTAQPDQERQRVETAMNTEQQEQRAAEAQYDQNKSPWWEPRDWNYINSF